MQKRRDPYDPTLIRRAVTLMAKKDLHCLTTDIKCSGGCLSDHVLYSLSNIAQRGSRFSRPFASLFGVIGRISQLPQPAARMSSICR